ncbi:golgin subfamily A member 6-like protein 22 [Nematostella vectensis]|uniref:golgin subfamily A member 6-like protein 22 n=1 Tax=Nematostella vectensis TaxID=45351 RepID=UPI00207755E2|nr:golgin subfamily A member 6-like protein 22 [Nematostella vectensis]XP_048577801.1 golgin subfamily A member 6-like protein 22 [Nematostella vectensis]XP_048583124.1 golgin subfamily A member 6-like protein 22 [Nematostella vectensis]
MACHGHATVKTGRPRVGDDKFTQQSGTHGTSLFKYKMSEDKKVAEKRELFIWKFDSDVSLLKEVIAEEPHKHPYASKERGQKWDKIALNLKENHGFKVTQRSVRKRFNSLHEDFLKKEKKEKRDSGGEVMYDEKHQMLTDYNELIEDWERERKERVDDEKVMAEDMRKKATERLSATKKRKESGEDKGEEDQPKRKTQQSLVQLMEQSIAVRSQERARELEIRENELKQQQHFHGFLLQQQQQAQQMHMQQQQQQQAMNMAMMNVLTEMLNAVKNAKTYYC